MTLIDGDRIVTIQLYDDEYEVFTEKKMSIIDYINAYTDEGVTATDIVEQTRWIPVSERLPEVEDCYDVTRTVGNDLITSACFFDRTKTWYNDNRINQERNPLTDIIAWMPLPEPYETESEVQG